MDSRTLKRDLARDSNGIHRASKAYQKHCRDPKGVRRNLTAFQRDFAEDPMEFIWIPRYIKRAVGIVREFIGISIQREFTIIGIPREFIWIPRHSRGILLRIRMESMRIPRHSKKVFTTVGIVNEFIEFSRHSKRHFAS